MDSSGTIFSSGVSSPVGSTVTLLPEREKLNIAPNPVVDVSLVSVPGETINNFKIINSFGVTVFSSDSKNILEYKIDARNFISGVYIIILNSKNLEYHKKIIINSTH